jgi:hypothetical protein
MKDLEKSQPFTVTVNKTSIGVLTMLVAENEVSAKDNISCKGNILLANYIYGKGHTYRMHYTIVAADGTTESYEEEDGILPTLFLSPGNENYISLVPYHPDKELEISIPVFDRANTELPKGNKPFTGDFTGTYGQFSIFYDVDSWSDTKPDKMLAIEFKDGIIRKKHNVKIPLPRNNKICINNGIQLLARDGNNWIHRHIDEKGNVVKQRTILSKHRNFQQVISLSLDEDSWLLAQDAGRNIVIEKIAPEGEVTTIKLWPLGDTIYNTWQPERIAANRYVIRFNTEFGNGWFTVEEGKLLELFYGKGVKGYKNLLTEEVIEMSDDPLILSGISKTLENAYAVVCYTKPKQGKENTLLVLNRQLS